MQFSSCVIIFFVFFFVSGPPKHFNADLAAINKLTVIVFCMKIPPEKVQK